MSDSLYAMTNSMREIRALINNGELSIEDAMDSIESMELLIKEKAHNLSAFILNEESSVDEMKKAEKAMAERRKLKEKSISRLKEYLLDSMIKNGIEELECPQWKVVLRKCPESVAVHDAEAVPDKYKKTKITKSIDKVSIKKALKKGEPIEGVTLEQNKTLKWS